ncbi:MAG: hypothetical protein ABJC63_09550, partial [Gemmatimonadales bacterium]
MEIGDTIETQNEPDLPRKRGRKDARSNHVDAVTTASTGTRRRNAGTRSRGNGNGNGGGSGGGHLADVLAALRDLRDGDFTVRLPSSDDKMLDEIAATFNVIAERNERLTAEAVRVSTTIGREGQMNERASIGRV